MDFLRRAEPYGLTPGELLNILNLRPKCFCHLFAVRPPPTRAPPTCGMEMHIHTKERDDMCRLEESNLGCLFVPSHSSPVVINSSPSFPTQKERHNSGSVFAGPSPTIQRRRHSQRFDAVCAKAKWWSQCSDGERALHSIGPCTPQALPNPAQQR